METVKDNALKCVARPTEVLMDTPDLVSEKIDFTGTEGKCGISLVSDASNTEMANADSLAEKHVAGYDGGGTNCRELSHSDHTDITDHKSSNPNAESKEDVVSAVYSEGDNAPSSTEISKSVLHEEKDEVAICSDRNIASYTISNRNCKIPVSGTGDINDMKDRSLSIQKTLPTIKTEFEHQTSEKKSSERNADSALSLGEMKPTVPITQSQHSIGGSSEQKQPVEKKTPNVSAEIDPDSVKGKLGSAIKFSWPAQTVSMALHNNVPPTAKGRGSITTQTFVLKKVSKNVKLTKLPGAQYKIRPVFGGKPKRNCPVVYVGAPFMSNPEDFSDDDEKKEKDLTISSHGDVPNSRTSSMDEHYEMLKSQIDNISRTTFEAAVSSSDVYDLGRMKDVFAPPEIATRSSDAVSTVSSSATDNSVDDAARLQVHTMRSLCSYGSSMVLPRPRLGKDDLVDMAAAPKVQPTPCRAPPTNFVFTPSNITGLPVTEYRIIRAKDNGVLPQLIRTSSAGQAQPIQPPWQGVVSGKKIIVATAQKPVLIKSPDAQHGISGALIEQPSPTPKPAGSMQAIQKVSPRSAQLNHPAIQQNLGPSIASTAVPGLITGQTGVQTVSSPLVLPKPNTKKAPNSLISVNLPTAPVEIKRVQAISVATVSTINTVSSTSKKIIHLTGLTKIPNGTALSTKTSVPRSIPININAGDSKRSIAPVPTPQPKNLEVKEKDNFFTFAPLRYGVEVKFADGVRHHITKLSDMMYQDDEPIKSWSELKKGTKVAALWTDGLIYDATVTRCSTAVKAKEEKSQKAQMQPVVKLEKLNPKETQTSRKNEQPRKDIPTQIMCSRCRVTFSKVLAFRKHQKEQCKSPGINVAHTDAEKLCRAKSDVTVQAGKNIVKKANNATSKPADQKYFSPPRRGRKRKQRPSADGESKRLKTDNENTQVTDNAAKGSTADTKKWTSPLIDGKPVFCNGTKFLHRWQLPDGGSKWYHGRITKIISPDEGRDCEFAVTYKGEEDQGPYVVKLYEDYPADIRLIKF